MTIVEEGAAGDDSFKPDGQLLRECHPERLMRCQRTAHMERVLQIDLKPVNHLAKDLLEPCAVLRQKDPSRRHAVMFSKCVLPFLMRKN